MASVYKFYNLDDDQIVSKHAAIFKKEQELLCYNKSVVSDCIVYYSLIPAATVSFLNVWSASRGVLLCRISLTFFFIIKPTRCINFPNLFCHETLHLSGSSSAHHQEFIHCTLGTGICHTCLKIAFQVF